MPWALTDGNGAMAYGYGSTIDGGRSNGALLGVTI
jgi:hypothetical protein